MAPVMAWTLLLAVVAFTLLYAYLVALRLRVGRLEERAVAEALSPRLGPPAAAPRRAEDGEACRARVDDVGYLVAGYLITPPPLGGYIAEPVRGAARPGARREAVAARRDRPRPLDGGDARSDAPAGPVRAGVRRRGRAGSIVAVGVRVRSDGWRSAGCASNLVYYKTPTEVLRQGSAASASGSVWAGWSNRAPSQPRGDRCGSSSRTGRRA